MLEEKYRVYSIKYIRLKGEKYWNYVGDQTWIFWLLDNRSRLFVSPIIMTVNSTIMTKSKLCILHNVKTNWSNFQELLTTTLDNSILLKIDNNIVCTIDSFNHAVQQDVSNVTGSSLDINTEYSSAIEDKLAENRKLRKL